MEFSCRCCLSFPSPSPEPLVLVPLFSKVALSVFMSCAFCSLISHLSSPLLLRSVFILDCSPFIADICSLLCTHIYKIKVRNPSIRENAVFDSLNLNYPA